MLSWGHDSEKGEVQTAEMKREIIIEYMRNVFRRIEF